LLRALTASPRQAGSGSDRDAVHSRRERGGGEPHGGAVDVAYSATINYPQGETLQQNDWAGKVEYYMGTPRYIHFQMRDWGNTS